MSKFLEKYLKHEGLIRKVIKRYTDTPEDVDDLAQETFLKCFVAESRTQISDFKAFVLIVARNTAITELKRKSNWNSSSIDDDKSIIDSELGSAPSLERELEAREHLVLISKIVSALPSDMRRAFILRKMDGLKYRQIASMMDLPVTTVHRLIAKALVECSTVLNEGRNLNSKEEGFQNKNSEEGDLSKPYRRSPHQGVVSDD